MLKKTRFLSKVRSAPFFYYEVTVIVVDYFLFSVHSTIRQQKEMRVKNPSLLMSAARVVSLCVILLALGLVSHTFGDPEPETLPPIQHALQRILALAWVGIGSSRGGPRIVRAHMK